MAASILVKSLCFLSKKILLGVKKYNNLYLRLVTPSSGWKSPILLPENIYSTGVTHDDYHLWLSNFFTTDHGRKLQKGFASKPRLIHVISTLFLLVFLLQKNVIQKIFNFLLFLKVQIIFWNIWKIIRAGELEKVGGDIFQKIAKNQNLHLLQSFSPYLISEFSVQFSLF